MALETKTGGEINPQLAQIIELAKRGTENEWMEIEDLLPEIVDQETFTDWAKNNLNNEDANLRDLSATILEQSGCEISDKDLEKLLVLMKEADKNIYPSFRAACALANRIGNDKKIKPHLDAIQEKLHQYFRDNEVHDIAYSYYMHLKTVEEGLLPKRRRWS